MRKEDILRRNNWIYQTTLKLSICNLFFVISCVILSFVLLRPLLNVDFFIYSNAVGKIDYLTLITFPFGSSGFTQFAPLFPVLPFSLVFVNEYRSGYLKSVFIRVGRKKYIQSRIISVMISGALVMAIPYIILYIFVIIMGVPTTPENISGAYDSSMWLKIAFIGGGSLVLLGKLILAVLFGILWSLVALFASTIFLNQYVTLILPFALYQCLWYATSVLRDYFWFVPSPTMFLRGDVNQPENFIWYFWYICMVQIAFIFILSKLCKKGIDRRIESA